MKNLYTLILFGLLCAGTVSAQSGETEELAWNINEGVLTVYGTGIMPDYDKFGNFPPWYEHRHLITDVTIEWGLTTIGQYAFYGLFRITSMVIPASVTGIGEYAFEACEELTYVFIPASVNHIGDYAFMECGNLKEIVNNNPQPQSFDRRLVFRSVHIGACILRVPNDAMDDYQNTEEWGNFWIMGTHPAGPLVWSLDWDELVIRGDGEMPDYTLATPAPWASQKDDILSIDIGAGVTSIGVQAFAGYDELVSVAISNSVTKIGILAFSGCEKLTTINLPSSLTIIENGVFTLCESLTSIDFPSSLTSIGIMAFGGSGLKQVVIPPLVTSIGDLAFLECHSLLSVVIPASVSHIGNQAFTDCIKLAEVVNYRQSPQPLSSGFTFIDFITNETKLYVPKDSRSLYESDFEWGLFPVIIEMAEMMLDITSVNLLSGMDVTLSAMITPPALPSEIIWTSSNPSVATVDGNGKVTAVSPGLAIITVSVGPSEATCEVTVAEFMGSDGSIWWTFLNNELVIGGVGDMPDYEYPPWYDHRASIQNVEIGESITGIGAYAFYTCASMISVSIPASITKIGKGAFEHCMNLASVTIPSAVTSIGEGAFAGCNALTHISLESDNTYYSTYDGVLFETDNQKIIAYPGGKSGTIYYIPPTVHTIGHSAFKHNIHLNTIIIPASVVSIESAAFSLSNLPSISIPSAVTNIDDNAFIDCLVLTEIEVQQNNNKYYSEEGVLFDQSRNMLVAYPAGKNQDVYIIPEKIEALGNTAFRNCQQLTSVTIPSSVTTIGNQAFAFCKNLTELINFNPTPQAIASSVFWDVNMVDCILRVPDVSAYEKAPEWMAFKNILPLEAVITLDKEDIYLLAGAKAEITVTISGVEADDDLALWDNSAPEVVKIDLTCASNSCVASLTALSPGTAIITVSVQDKQEICTVTVIQPGNTTINGTVDADDKENVRVNLYIKPPVDSKKGIVGGYVLLATVIPNDNGEYSFENLPEGDYQVEVIIDDFEPQATDVIPISGNDSTVEVNFSLDEETGTVRVIDVNIPTGVQEMYAPDLKAYPNPFTDVIRITGTDVEAWHGALLQVINVAGAIVHTQKIIHPDEAIRLDHLPAGLYIIRLHDGGKRSVTIKTLKL